jgi:hypothetical protein
VTGCTIQRNSVVTGTGFFLLGHKYGEN